MHMLSVMYGVKAEDVAYLEDWICPRCRCICNCSTCMKKCGVKPTGVLVQMAKAGGFSSVSDLLHVKGAHSVSHYNSAKQIGRKQPAPEEGTMTTSPKKLGKENIFDGKDIFNCHSSSPAPC
ncbi:Zinc-finger domain of monoamine-oxidase A repressor R1 [Cynara cardunculus var. scolymus]|uniref:Zinc-finger domain of monoamine-oxidase A repressor R1 n=1 Tax=Cynara cardunculus var. scolymus TaxID=59895 RepID=A0A103Y5D7_CYNCS|nr:Zinc-finger domain of monoamine-oxidase A repressor R1 [Cynara cardunculus var. scolymus]